MNDVNWTRHLNACPVRKSKRKNQTIKTFFTLSQAKKICKDFTRISECDKNSETLEVEAVECKKPTTSSSEYEKKIPEKSTFDGPYTADLEVMNTDDIENSNTTFEEPIVSATSTCLPVPEVMNTDDIENSNTTYEEPIVSATSTCLPVPVPISEVDFVAESSANASMAEHLETNIDLQKNESPEDLVESVASLPYAIQFPNDPAFISNFTMSPELFAQVALQPPCQPAPFDLKNHKFPTKKQGKYTRSFHEEHYFKKMASGKFVKRIWVSYSPSTDKVYCIVCKLFGTTECKSYKLAKSGYDDWKHLAYALKNHEATPDHLQAEIRRAMYVNNQRVDLPSFQGLNSKVVENREIIKKIIKALLYLSRQNMAFRGHDESKTSKNQGNFLELIKLLSADNAVLSSHLLKIRDVKGKNRLTFLSNVSQNKILNVLGEMVRGQILQKIKASGVYSFIIDTTTDVANLEQLSLIVRFLNEDGDVEERLVAIKVASDASGLGMFNLLCDICQHFEIDWVNNLCAQSYDGAASMQGCYSGVKTLVQEKNPRAIYVWCFAHVLNLVVVDTCDKNTVTRIFFGNLQSLVSFMRARKRTALFIEAQKIYYPNERICKIKNFSNTRWTSHHQVLGVICTKYKAVMKTLKDLSLSLDRETSATAKNLQTVMSSFMFVTNLLLMKNVFEYTTPLSLYLQSPSIDFIQALTMVDNCAKNLFDMREDHTADKLLDNARQFAEDNGLEQTCFPNKRNIIKKVMDGEKKGTETIFLSPNNRYKIEVYNTVLDQIISSISSRFEGARKILADLSFFSYERLISINEGCSIPEDCFIYLKTWIPNIEIDELKMEYITFAKCFMELKNGINIKKLHNKSEPGDENDDDELHDSSSDTETESNTDAPKITALDIIKLLNSYNLISAFPNLYTAYKYACTIPATSASCERSFSKLKLIKTRLRSTMKQNLLEPLMLLSCERNIEINEDEAINNYANTSKILKEALLFK
ncbi:unnamed protein product [Macrosiphum euphorbiae]|nr:unnamed protein product [Macrosiphum euphorbiae]